MFGTGRAVVSRAIGTVSALVVLAMLAGCTPVNDPSAGMSVTQTIALVDQTPASDLELAGLVEAFAFGTRVSDAQRVTLERQLVGRRVEWDIPVNDVRYVEGRFELATTAIPSANRAEAVPVLRVVAFVVPRNDAEQARLMQLRTDDTIRIRGVVQELRKGKVVVVVPAIIVGQSLP
jgi:hypothetical protein